MKGLRLIIFGGRDFTDFKRVKDCVYYFTRNLDDNDIEIVSGGCDRGIITFTREDGKDVCGADGLGELLAKENGWPVKIFNADWKKYGKSAGPRRNKEMADYGTAALGFWDGVSSGTKSMMELAEKKGLNMQIENYIGYKKQTL